MKKILLNFINPFKLFKAYRYHKQNAKFDKSSYDLELSFYSKILKNDMLHWGYFDDIHIPAESISVKQVEDAQVKYAENIIAQIVNREEPVLDVGCGMGGLSKLIHQKGFDVEALTPNSNQKDYFNIKHTEIICHHCKFEDLRTDKKFGTVINSESLQYIALDKAFENAEKILFPGGRWIITDYFRMKNDGINRSSHLLDDFLKSVEQHRWKIVYQQDITLNVLPTARLVFMYAQRFLLPVKDLALEKLRYKKGWLYYLIGDLRDSISKKITKELAAVDPEKFIAEKKYMLFVLEKVKG